MSPISRPLPHRFPVAWAALALTLIFAVLSPFSVPLQGADLKWNSTGDTNWDLTSLNWLNLGTSGADRFEQGDTVRFDDSGAFPASIHLATTLSPSAVTINSTVLHYRFEGSGKLSGIANGLTKSGASTLTLGTANDFLGPVNVTGGTLRLGSTTGLGSVAGGTTVGNGATFDLAGLSPGLEPFNVRGPGLNGIGAVINTGANLVNDGLRGAVTLSGDTAFGGPSRWDVIGGTLTGNGHKLTKTGTAEIALSNLGNTGLGEIDVQQGILTLLGSTQPGDPAKTMSVKSNAVLAFWATGTNIINKPLALEWAEVRNVTTGGTDVSTNIGAVNLAGNNTFNLTASVRLKGEIGGDGGITKTGTGMLALDNDNFYSGDTFVLGGRVTLGSEGGLGGSQSVFLGPEGILDASALPEFRVRSTQNLFGDGVVHGSVTVGSGAYLLPGFSAGTLTITNHLMLEAGSVVMAELGSSTVEGGGINDLLTVGGNLILGGEIFIQISPLGPLDVANPYTLIRYNGSLIGNGSGLTFINDTRMNFALDLTTPGKVMVRASGATQVARWTGGNPAAPTDWDVKNTPNWTTTVAGDLFFAGDTAVFNDLASVFNVTLVGELHAGHTRVEANANNYVFSGDGRIRGGGLTKSQSGRLTLANAGLNDYPGATTINGGILQVGNGGTAGSIGPGNIVNNGRLVFNRSDALAPTNTLTGTGVLEKQGNNLLTLPASFAGFDGSIVVNAGTARPVAPNSLGTAVGGTTVANGGTLDLNGLNLGLESVTVSGAGVGGNGAIVNSGTAQNNALRVVTLAGDTTFAGANRWDIRNPGTGASLTGNGFTLTKSGANQVSLVGVGNTGLGSIDVRQGLLSVEGNTGLGAPAGTVGVQSGATLMFWGNTVPQEKQFVLNNGAHLFKDSGSATINGTVSLTGSNALESANNSGTDLIINAAISGPGSLTKLGAGHLILGGVNTYSGSTLVQEGVLIVAGSLGAASGGVQVAPGATLAGSGVINDAITIQAGGTLSPGLSPGAFGRLTIPRAVALAGVTLLDIARNGTTLTNDQVASVTTLTLGGTLNVQSSGSPLQGGDTFQLFTATTFEGAFAAVNLPALPAGLTWDQSALATAGRISVNSPQQPILISPVINVGNLTLGATGGTPGATYRVLASVEVGAPLSSWTEVATGTFNPSGSFSISIAVNPGEPRKFYTVQMP